MNKAKTLSLILLIACAGLVHAQSFNNIDGSPQYTATTGAIYRHIFTGAIYLTTPNTAAISSVTSTLPNGLFDDGESISYATGLTNLESPIPDPSSTEVILQVENITINSGRTQYTTFIRFNRDGIATFTRINRIGFKVIMIGSAFNLQSGVTLPSAFARNGKFVDVSTTNSLVDSAQFDFASNTGQPSPFAFTPVNARCGVAQRGGFPTIEVLGCARTIMLTFVTGASGPITGANINSIFISSYIVKDRTIVAAPNTILSDLQLTQSNPDYLYMTGSDDTIFGPTVMFKTQASAGPASISKIQLSIVFVGLNQFTAATYPASSTDAFIVAVGGANYPLTSPGLTTANAVSLDGLRTTNPNLDINLYNPNTKMGHLFCGLTGIAQRTEAGILTSTNTNILNFADTKAVATGSSSAACILFATKSTCTNDQKQVLTSTTFSQTSTTTSTTTPVTVTSNNLEVATNAKNLYSFTVGSYAGFVTTTSITKNYTIPATVTEVVVDFQFSSTGNPIGQVQFTANIAGQVFNGVLTTTSTAPTATIQTYFVHVPLGTTLVPVTITIQTTATPALSTSLKILQGLSYLNVVYNSLSCGTFCPEAINQTTGVDPTTNPPTCIYCDSNLNQFYFNGKCVCRNNFFLSTNNTCQPCNDPLCITCTASATCTVCAGNATLSGGSCACSNGFYRNGSVCLPCPSGCAICSSPTACTSCLNNRNTSGLDTRSGINGNCACLPGLFDVSTSPVCSLCSPSCATCAINSTNCLSCNTAANFVLSQNTCVCANGFYLLNNNCVPCNPVCSTCAVSSVYCTSCPPLRVLAGTSNPQFKTCNCNSTAGYVQVNYVCVDNTCTNIDPKCQLCTLDATSLTSRQCLTCIDNRIVVNGVCVCKPGFFQNATGFCAPCGAGCQQCINATTCQSCATGSTSNGDGTCTCRAGFVLVTFSANLYCQPCSTNCTACSQVSTNCTSCRAGFNVVNGQCVCPAGTFTAPDGSQCIPCSAQCLACSSPTNCFNCANGYIFDTSISSCTLNCPPGTFNSGTQCTACPTGCLSCYTQAICSSCAPGLNMFAGSCRSLCPDSTYANNGQCLSCNSRCKTCSSLTQCNSCNSPFVLFANQCVDDCINGTYFFGGSCLACNASCATCSGTANTCTSCAVPQVLYNSACYSTCPVAIVNGVCTNNCPSGTFLNGNNCSPCNSVCRTCDVIASNCTSCATTLSFNGACVNNCPPGTTAINGFCSNCDQSCLLCSGTIFNCTQCATGYVRSSTGTCTKVCPAGFFVDLINNICSPCGTGCLQCTSLTQCNQCNDSTLTPLNGACQRTCPAGANLVGGVCICSFGVLQNSVCVSACSTGFYANSNKQCLPCTSPCLACSGSPTSCSSCVAGFNYDAVNRVCNPSSACPYGAFLDIAGNCQSYCPFSYFLGGCIFQCPSGYQPNAYNGCVLSTSPTFCQAPLFQLGSSCVTSCPSGYTPNSVTRNCDQCFANCQQCLSNTLCTSCAQGYILNSDQTACILSSTCIAGQVQYKSACYATCPTGTYQQGQICVRSCPADFYFYNNFCYPTCFSVTQFFNLDACFTQCPPNTPGCLASRP